MNETYIYRGRNWWTSDEVGLSQTIERLQRALSILQSLEGDPSDEDAWVVRDALHALGPVEHLAPRPVMWAVAKSPHGFAPGETSAYNGHFTRERAEIFSRIATIRWGKPFTVARLPCPVWSIIDPGVTPADYARSVCHKRSLLEKILREVRPLCP